jgi:chemotaxis methyl-accepting protein methylase
MQCVASASDQVAIHDHAFAAIVSLLCERFGIDFRRYRPATLRRRVLNRMISVRARTFEEYLQLLGADEAEPERLLARVTIKVSRFYRNAQTFDALFNTVLPELLRHTEAPLRVLSAGCGNGEEAYTLAMLLEEREAPGTIDAIDIDPQALASAAQGHYEEAVLGELPLALRDRYLVPTANGYEVTDSLRRRIVFSLRDITAMAPLARQARYDLVCCRNVLIYFERAIQERSLSTLCRSIRAGGFLCLGEAEWPMPTLAAAFQPLPHKTRIFRLHTGIAHVQE